MTASASYDGVTDLTRLAPRPPSLELFLVSASAFVVCESVDLQQLAYLTNTPSLIINAKDPFVAYPVRANGLMTLSTAIDLDTAQAITITRHAHPAVFQGPPQTAGPRTEERQPRISRQHGDELIDAITEMQAGIAAGRTTESESQSRFRTRVVEAGAALAAVSAHVADWGPDDGFIGDGRLVRFQADRVS
jgi:hypothetical protein